MKNIKHLLSIHAARLAVLLAVLAPAALVKGQVYPPPTVIPAFTNGDFETGDFTGWSLSGDTCGTSVAINSVRHGYQYQAHSGIFEAILGNCGDPDSSGYLSQRMSTGNGGYVCGLSISFWVNNIHGDPNPNLSVSCDGTTFFGPQNLATTSGWVNIQTNTFFVGMNGSSVLQFGFNDPDGVFALDDISLQWTDMPVHGWFSYTTNNDGTFNITGCSGCGGALIFPGWINLTNVTSIGNNAFQNNTSLISVTFAGNGLTSITFATNVTMNSSHVTTIGSAAFSGCTGLTNVSLPNSLTNLGSCAFSNCTSLTNVTMGTNLISIGTNAFQSCTALAGIVIPNSVTSLGSSTFSNCISLANVTIGTNVTRIGNSAFQNCASLTSVTIPGSVTNLGGSAFASCAGLTNATIGTNVANLGSCAFSNCTSLAAVYFQGNAPSADSTVFTNDPATVYYLPGTTGWNASTFDGRPAVLLNPPYLCTTTNGAITIIGYTGSGGAVTIPGTINNLPVTAISSGAFQNCASLTSVTIPASVTNIADTAFQNCSSLAGVYFLGNAPSLGGASVFLNDNNALGYNAAGTTGWGLTFGDLTMVLFNNSTIDAANHFAYGANLGWVDWRGDTSHGAVIGTNICSGYIYSANFGWISLGNGSPVNGLYYQNNSASDFGVNVDSSGNLRGFAYGANIGWITFTNFGAPQVDLATGKLSGSVWSANWGWISLSNVEAYVQTSPIQQSSPPVTAPILGGITFTGGGGGGSNFGFSFTNVPNASSSFTVWASTDLALPFSDWTRMGHPVETSEGSYSLYQFTDPQANNNVQRFYRVTSP